MIDLRQNDSTGQVRVAAARAHVHTPVPCSLETAGRIELTFRVGYDWLKVR